MSEKIGEVLVDTTYYNEVDLYSDGDETEDRLLEIVSKYNEKEFPRLIQEETSWPLLYHLSPIRECILNWFPFQQGENILELGAGCGAVTGAFLGNGANVTAVDLSLRRSRINATRHRNSKQLKILIGNMEDVLGKVNDRYNHVTLIGVLEYAAVFNSCKDPFSSILNAVARVLKDDGSLWIAIENKLGLKYYAGCREDHTGRLFESIEGYPHHDGPETFSRKGLQKLANDCGYEIYFYYPYPDYKFPIKIFSDDYLPQRGELTRNWQNFDADRVQLYDESKAFDSVVEAGLFPDSSNSFLARLRKKVRK